MDTASMYMVKQSDFMSRDEWGAFPPLSKERMSHPITKVLFSAENEFYPCFTTEECIKSVQSIQKHYMDKGLEDIPYNFLIGNDGKVYEGRGWHYKPGTDIQKNHNYKDQTIDIAVICGWHPDDITPNNMDMLREAFKSAKELIAFGVRDGKIDPNHEFDGFSDDVKPTEPMKPVGDEVKLALG